MACTKYTQPSSAGWIGLGPYGSAEVKGSTGLPAM